jgi:hypothetical protein
MVTEATWQSRGPGFGLLAGVHSRQAWRPPALRGVESVLSGIASRNEPLDRHRARLTAWYEQFARRSQPFVGWQPLTTGELGVDDTQPSFDSVQSGDRTVRRESQTISKDPPQDASVVKPVAQDQPPATHSHRVPAEPQMLQKPLVLRRSISGSIHTTARSLPSREPRRAPDLSGKPEGPMEAAVQPVAPPGREISSGASRFSPFMSERQTLFPVTFSELRSAILRCSGITYRLKRLHQLARGMGRLGNLQRSLKG